MYTPVLITPATIKPITLTEAKAALDISYTDKDTLITGLIAAATSHFENILERPLGEQSWLQSFDEVCGSLNLPKVPVISITSVKYLDVDGVEQTIDAENYVLVSEGMSASVRFNSSYTAPTLYSETPNVTVLYKAGYANAGIDPIFTSTAPDAIKQAIIMLIRQWFDNPSAVSVGTTVAKMPNAVEALLSSYYPMNV